MHFRTWKISRGAIFAAMIVLGSWFLQSCFLNTTNSFTADKPCGGSSDEDFCALQTMLKPSGCFTAGCHSEWANYDEPEDYGGLIVAGDSGSSPLYTQLTGAGQGGSMPLGSYPNVPTSYLTKIADYIDGL